MTKKIVRCMKFIVAVLLFLTLTNVPTIAATTTLKIGDYVKFGSYNGEPILWRVINLDEKGDPLLFADKIISFKAFDTSGEKHIGERRFWGSNEWESSNIRQWLNSTEDQIKWFNNVPNDQNTWNINNAYDKEGGFLSNDNFSESELNAIKPVTHDVTLSDSDKFKKTGGTELHTYDMGFYYQDVLLNYDKSYYKNVKDNVFLLSIKEVINYVHNRGWSYNALPTQLSLDKSIYGKYTRRIETMGYWLRTPNATVPSEVRVVSGLDGIGSSSANSGDLGVRPALFVDLAKIKSASGLGTLNKPYVLEGTDQSKMDVNKFKFSSTARESVVPNPSKKYPVFIFIDGIPLVSIDAAPFVDGNGRTMIPLKAVSDYLGSTVSWDSVREMVTVKSGDKTIELPVNQNYGFVNQEKIEFDTKTIVKNGRTFVPLRFISEQLGFEINYRFDLNPIAGNVPGHMIEVGKPAILISPIVNKGWTDAHLNVAGSKIYYSMFRKIPTGDDISQIMALSRVFYMSSNPSDGSSFNWCYIISYEKPGEIIMGFNELVTGWDEFTIHTLTALLGIDGTIIGTQLVKDIMSTYDASTNTYYASRLNGKVLKSGKYTLDYTSCKITWKEEYSGDINW